jgi:outer membrane protein
MTRPVRYRAVAFISLAALSLGGTTAVAAASDPVEANQQADAQSTAQTQPPTGQPPTSGLQQQPGAATTPQGPTPKIQTPAEQKYGLPRNPIVGGLVDIDLTKPLSLERAIQIGLQRQNQIGIAVAQRDQNSARLVEARSSYYPQITPTFQFSTGLTPTYEVPFTNTGTGTGTGAGVGRSVIRSIQTQTQADALVARQLIWDTGIREATVGYNRRQLFASEYNIGDVRQTVISNVTQAYYALLRDKELVQVQEESVKRAQTTLDSIVAQIQVGNAAMSDRLQSESDLANAKVALLQAQNSAYVDEASLKNTMGVATSQPLVLTATTVPKPDTTPDSRTQEDYVQQAYRYRLDQKQQQELVNAQGYQVKIANINAGVTVNATVSEGYALDPNAGEERSFVVAFSYPLFDGGQTRAVVRENKAILEQDRRQLDQLQQDIRFAVEQDYLTREVSRQQVVAAQVAVDAGQANYDAALAKQQNGLINIVDVITAEVQLVTARVQQVEAVYNFYIADARLQRDIGQNDPKYHPNVPPMRTARNSGQTNRLPTALTAPDSTDKIASASPKAPASADATGKQP